MDCPNEKILSSYLDEVLSETERNNVETHISECNHCLDVLLVAYDAGSKSRKCPALLKEKIRRRLGFKEKKKHPELKWLFGALFLFMLSFVVKKFFLQFLLASVILGFKWVMEGEGAKRVIMIFKGIDPKENKLKRESSRVHNS